MKVEKGKASAVVEVIPDERGKVEHRKMRKKERKKLVWVSICVHVYVG